MMAFIYAVLRILSFEDEGSPAVPRRRQIEIDLMAEVLAANACAVLVLAGTMIGLASIFVHLIRFIQAYGGL
jgi:hypothetical protein